MVIIISLIITIISSASSSYSSVHYFSLSSRIVVQLTEEDASEVESNASISETNVDGEAYSAGESDEDSTTVTDSTNTTSSTRT